MSPCPQGSVLAQKSDLACVLCTYYWNRLLVRGQWLYLAASTDVKGIPEA
jgi:hypothetical protein